MKIQELNVLVEINKAFASIQDRQQLFKTIFEKIQPIFHFYDIGLFIINEEDDYHTDLATEMPQVSPSEANLEIAQQQQKRIPHRGSAVEWMMDEASGAGGSVILDYDRIIQKFPEHPHIPIIKKIGFKESLAGILKIQGNVIGAFCMNSLQKDFFKHDLIPFFKAITDQLAVAVGHVLAHEKILEEKRFKEVLLQVTDAVAKTHDRNELLRVIFEHVKSALPFDHAGLFIVEEESDKFWEILDEGTLNPGQDKLAIERLLGPWRYSGQHPDSWVYVKSPSLFDVEKQSLIMPNPQWEHIIQWGLKQLMAIPLRIKGKEFALMCLLSKEKDFYKERHFPIFQAVADQLAIAVSNVLANERLLEEKQFSETLLGISKAIASIQDRRELFRVIFKSIQPIFPFDEFGLFVLDETGKMHYELTDATTLDALPTQKLIENALGKNTWYEHEGTSVAWLMEHGPVVISMRELDATAPHPQHPYMIEGGLKELIGGPLKQGSAAFGMLCLTSKEENCYGDQNIALFEAIADQLGVAVSNVLANEEILKRQKEKEALLTISKKIVTIRDEEDLGRVLVQDLQPIFNFADAVVLAINAEDDCYYPLAFVAPPEIRGNPYFETVSKLRRKYKGSPQEKFFYSFTPTEILVNDLAKTYPGFEPLMMLQKAGIKKILGISLNQGGKAIGSLLFHYKDEHEDLRSKHDLFVQVTDQVSVAVANILANRALQRRELEEGLKLAMVNALNEGSNWEKKLLRVTHALQEEFPFHLASYGMIDDSPGTPNFGFERIGPGEYRTISIASFLKMTQMEDTLFAEEVATNIQTKPNIFNGEDYVQEARRNLVQKHVQKVFGINSMMIIPLSVGNERLFYVTFYSKEAQPYRKEHLALFERIGSSFKLAMEKQLNYQEVLRLNELISEEKAYLEEELQLSYNFGEIVGSSKAMQEVFEQVRQVANTHSNVLITGETGTGKELIARALHNYSHRKKHNFIRLNCATLPAELLESELFGHEKGAFTGAHQRRIGKFELANKGTIFLDEIGEMPLGLQAKLLRVLQEREFERLGGNDVLKTDVRVVTATNRDLQKEVTKGNFRSDLFYRLNVFPIHLPPLRERKEDIPELAKHFIEKHNKRVGKKVKKASEKALKNLLAYQWPGNVRELEHVIERSMITAKGAILDVVLGKEPSPVYDRQDTALQPLKTYKQAEIDLIMNTLKFTAGKISGPRGAAEILDMHPATLESKMKKFGIKRQHVLQDTDENKKQ